MDRNRIVGQLTTRVEIGFAPEQAQSLENASVEDLKVIEIEEFGLGIHFPRYAAFMCPRFAPPTAPKRAAALEA